MKRCLFPVLLTCTFAACTVVQEGEPAPDIDTRDAWAIDGATDSAPSDGQAPVSDGVSPGPDLTAPDFTGPDGSEPPDLDPADGSQDPDGGAEDAPPPPDPCAGELAIVPALTHVEPRHFQVFTAEGGSGDIRFDLVDDTSGGTIHPLFGTFIAGPRSGTVRVQMVDRLCERSVDLPLIVTEPLALTPATAAIDALLGRLDFEVSGGSGQWALELRAAPAAPPLSATLTGARLRAGGVSETATVLVRDLRSGATRESVVTIAPGGGLTLEPRHLVLPRGEAWTLRVRGGSGHLDVSQLDAAASGGQPPVTVEGESLVASRVGTATLRVDDRYTGESLAMTVDIIEPPSAPLFDAGDNRLAGAALVADLDGDGHPELIVGVPEADIGGWNSGGVFVYRGIATGFQAWPSVTLGLDGRLDEFGGALAVGDIDGDGLLDLAVGAALGNALGVNRGEVHVFRGHAETLLETSAAAVFVGEDNSDRFGQSVALCDVNGDGRLDLIVGADLAEDQNRTPIVNNVGALYLHLGYERGFQRAPDQIVWGSLPTADGGEVVAANFNLGRSMAAGDVDGDGRCDLAVGALGYSAGPGRSSDGAVLVYRGRGPDGFGPGGLTPRPSLVVLGDAPESPGGQLGTSLAMGDLNGDGLDDLAMGQPEHRHFVGTSARTGNGAVAIWPGAAIPAEGTRIASVLDSPARYFGRSDVNEVGDRFGIAVAIGDWDGDGPLDLFIGARSDEQLPYCASNCGAVHVLAGVDGALPDTSGPAHVYSGDVTNQFFGFILAVAPDFDGDGLAELAGRAPRDSRLGSRVGATHVRSSDPDAPLEVFDFPRLSAGSALGSAVAVLPDLDGDGWPELAVGASNAQPEFEARTALHRPGVVFLYRGTADGVEGEPSQELGLFEGASSNEFFGDGLAVVQDFNGDGRRELAVIARLGNCPGGSTNVGAVYLFEEDGAGGYEPEPVVAFFGPQASQQAAVVVTADINGDGLADLVVGGPLWDRSGASTSDNGGGLGVIFGDSARGTGGERYESCDFDLTLLAGNGSERIGTSLSALGDLNGDGCHEIAAGAPFANVGPNATAGRVYILWGFGPSCAFAEPHASALSPGIRGARAGDSLAAGRVDGDPFAELIIGGTRWNSGVDPTGAVWLVDGAWLHGLAAGARPWHEAVAGSHVAPLAPHGQPPAIVGGTIRDEDFGASVALIAGAGVRSSHLVIGRPRSNLGGVERAGAAEVYGLTLSDGSFTVSPSPLVAVGGETSRPDSGFGATLSAWWQGASYRLVVGAAASSAVGLDDGAFFVTPLLSGSVQQ